MRRLTPADSPLPPGARLLACVIRSLDGVSWTTRVWAQADGTVGATVSETSAAGTRLQTRHEGVASLSELDQLLSGDLSRRGPSGSARLAVLSSAASAFEEASLRAA